jgi:hypothetical protein
MNRCRRCLILLALYPLAILAAQPEGSAAPPPDSAAAAGQSAATPVQAIWKHPEIPFYFQSVITFYSCTSLEDKLERVLRHMAPEVRARVRSADCNVAVSQITRIPYVVIDITSAVEATPQALAEQKKTQPTRELAARVRGQPLAGTQSSEQFAAQWKRISFEDRKLRLDPGDCELIDQIKRKTLPRLSVRIVEDRVLCNSNGSLVGAPRLVIEALMEAPKPDSPVDRGA